MSNYVRQCPICGKDISHSNYYRCQYSKKHKFKCRSCNSSGKNNGFYGKKHSKETKDHLSKNIDRSYTKTKEFSDKTKKGMNGKTNSIPVYDCWIKKYGKEIADIKQEIASKKKSIAASGEKNPMYGKLSPQGSGQGWKGWYNGHLIQCKIKYATIYAEENGMTYEIRDVDILTFTEIQDLYQKELIKFTAIYQKKFEEYANNVEGTGT